MRARPIPSFGIVVALIAVACGPIVPVPATPPVGSPLTAKGPLMAAFDESLARWQAAEIAHYAFTFTPSCFCPSSPSLIVVDGDAIRINGLPAGPAAPGSLAPLGVNGLFDLVRRAIQGDRVTVAYDPKTGVPLSMDSDPMANAIDDELSFTVTGWTTDPPDDAALAEVTKARRTWDGQGIHSYDWSIELDGTRYDIEVRGGTPTVRSGGKPVRDTLMGPWTVPDVFDQLVYAATTPQIELEATYDPSLGYPTRMSWHDSRPDATPSGTVRVLSFDASVPEPAPS